MVLRLSRSETAPKVGVAMVLRLSRSETAPKGEVVSVICGSGLGPRWDSAKTFLGRKPDNRNAQRQGPHLRQSGFVFFSHHDTRFVHQF